MANDDSNDGHCNNYDATMYVVNIQIRLITGVVFCFSPWLLAFANLAMLSFVGIRPTGTQLSQIVSMR